VRADGTKELVALADGERESTDPWAELLRDCRRRGMGRIDPGRPRGRTMPNERIGSREHNW
jgi:hypothetical protein